MAKQKPNKRKSTKRTTVKKVQETESLPPPTPPVNLPPPAPEPDDDPWGDDGLTLKQRLFAEAYIGPAAGNGTKAAQMAGYRDDNRYTLAQTASENLRKPNIQRAIARLVASKLGSSEWTRAGITEIANQNISAFLVEQDGEMTLDLKAAVENGALGVIKEIKEEGFQAGGQTVQIVKRTFKLYDRLRALEILAKMNGQVTEKHEHSGKDGAALPTPVVKVEFDYDSFARHFDNYAGRSGSGIASPNGN